VRRDISAPLRLAVDALTNDGTLAEEVRALRVHGAKKKYVHERVGWNMRLDAIQAAALRAKLPHLDDWNTARRRIATRYREELAGLDLILPKDAPGHVWHQFVMRFPGERQAVIDGLASRGVASLIYYPIPIHRQSYLQEHVPGAADQPLPVTDRLAEEVLAIPVHPLLSDEELSTIAGAVRAVASPVRQ